MKALLESVPHVLTPGWSLITRLPLLSRATVESSPVLPSSGPHFFRVDGVTVTHLVRSSWEESTSRSCKLPPTVLDKRTGAEAEAPILGPPDAKSRLAGKDPDAGKD